MKLRAYQETDWQAICHVWNRAKLDEFYGLVDPDAILPLEEDPTMIDYFHANQIIVGEVQGEIVGFAGHQGRLIGWLYVDPDHRQQGYGSRLLAEVIDMIGRDAYLNVAAANEPALGLYRRFGFQVKQKYQGSYNGVEIPALRLIRDYDGDGSSSSVV